MYGLSDLTTALSSPNMVLTELNRLYYGRLHSRQYNDNGINMFDEEWDNLLILDACRFDAFENCLATSGLDGTLEHRQSRGSATREWVRGNFMNSQHRDTVYVDSNGYYARLQDDINAEVYKYILVENDEFDGISVHPDAVTERAIEAADRYPNKRLLVHYLQPHHPFFGPAGDGIEYSGNFRNTVHDNGLDDDLLWEAYTENLDLVLESIQQFLAETDGKTVISSDHGELIGPVDSPTLTRYYGHPSELYIDPLVKVPWFVIDGNRRRIVAEQPEADQRSIDQEEVDEKLEKLGYKL